MLTNSEAESAAYFKSRKRTHLRGAIAGLVGYFPISIGMAFAIYVVQGLFSLFLPEGHALTKFVASSTAQTGSLLTSTLALFTGVLSGAFIAMWSPKGSRIVVAFAAVMGLASVAVSPTPDGLTTTQLVFWMFANPVGYLLGCEFFFWREHQALASQHPSKN